MPDFDDIKESVSDFVHEKPVLSTVIVIVVFLFLAGLIILLIQTSPEKAPELKQAEPFEQDAPILIPDVPDIEKEYFPNRVTENQWSSEEVKRWFTFPEDEAMTELEKANDKITDEVLQAAP